MKIRIHINYIKRWFVALHALPRIHKKLLQLLGDKMNCPEITNDAINNLVDSSPRSLRSLTREIQALEKRLSELERKR
jgi:hypothetical protein